MLIARATAHAEAGHGGAPIHILKHAGAYSVRWATSCAELEALGLQAASEQPALAADRPIHLSVMLRSGMRRWERISLDDLALGLCQWAPLHVKKRPLCSPHMIPPGVATA